MIICPWLLSENKSITLTQKRKTNRAMKTKPIYLLILVSFSLFTSANAQCIEGNCHQGEGVFILPNGNRYVGQFKNSLIQGQGAMYYTDGSRYLGEFRNGQPHGEGVRIFTDGSKQQGSWQYGRLYNQAEATTLVARSVTRTGCVSGDCQNGQGTFVFSGGAIYSGEFKNGEIFGEGICYYPDGSRYQGGWVNRYPDGNGVQTWPDGRTRIGRWRQGQPIDDQGRYLDVLEPTLPGGNGFAIQSGCLRGDCLNGQGYYAYPDGSRYEGGFSQGRPHGQGSFQYPNGDQYVGSFQNGLRHGQGTLTYADGRRLNGNWLDGAHQQTNPSTTANTNLGCISGDCQNGYGTYVYRKGDRYTGTFKNGYPEGNGEVVYLNGERYEGAMARGSFNGFGAFYPTTGVPIRGYWKDGAYVSNNAGAAQPSAQPARAANMPRVWALIVGVSAYRHMPVLRFPDDDAYRLYAFFKSPEGGAIPDDQIQVLIDEDATKDNITHQMRQLFGQAGPNDLIILYFSGHGLPGAFLPIDYDGQNNQLFHTEIKRLFESSQARYQLILADACHSGSLLAARGKQPDQVLNRYYETLSQTRAGSALIMSSKSEETSLESSGLRQGVFSHYLLRGLKGEADADGNQIVSVQELFYYVQNQVQNYTGGLQSPVIQGNYDPAMPVGATR